MGAKRSPDVGIVSVHVLQGGLILHTQNKVQVVVDLSDRISMTYCKRFCFLKTLSTRNLSISSNFSLLNRDIKGSSWSAYSSSFLS